MFRTVQQDSEAIGYLLMEDRKSVITGHAFKIRTEVHIGY